MEKVKDKKKFNKKSILIGCSIIVILIIICVLCFFFFFNDKKTPDNPKKPVKSDDPYVTGENGYKYVKEPNVQLPTYGSKEEALEALKKAVKKDDISFAYEEGICWYFKDNSKNVDILYECCTDDYIFRTIETFKDISIESAK